VTTGPVFRLAPRDRSWADDPAELAALWRWLDARGWPGDNGRRPEPAVFMEEAHRWCEERERMVTECPECEALGYEAHPSRNLWVSCEACGGTGRRT
jgi:hypothetical protein